MAHDASWESPTSYRVVELNPPVCEPDSLHSSQANESHLFLSAVMRDCNQTQLPLYVCMYRSSQDPSDSSAPQADMLMFQTDIWGVHMYGRQIQVSQCDRGASEAWTPLIRELCEPRTAVVARGNESVFEVINREIPLELMRVPSGSEQNGWVIPNDWEVIQCRISRDGCVVYDGAGDSLAVGYLSKSFQGSLSWDDLKPHLVTNPLLPEATMFHCQWQYRPWDADWMISMPYEVYQQLGPGNYQIDLVTKESPGEMLLGVADHEGESTKTIIFNSNNCHPHMANDGFAGTAVLIRLMQWLRQRDTHYSYRLLIAPEHLGSVFYIDTLLQREKALIVACIFEEMPGTQGPLKATETFLGTSDLDEAFKNVLMHSGFPHEIAPWRQGAGNDETVWEAPGNEIPCVEVTRCEAMFNPYPEYHSSADSWDLMDPARLDEMLEVLKNVIVVIEENVRIFRLFNGLPCLSNPKFNLYFERPDPTVNKQLTDDSEVWGSLLDSLLRYFDGQWSVLDIAQKHSLPFKELRDYIQRFADAGLVRLERVELPLVKPSQVIP